MSLKQEKDDPYLVSMGKQLILKSELSSIYNHTSSKVHNPSFSLCIAGGSFRSLFYKEPIKDVDVFLLTDYETALSWMKSLKLELGVDADITSTEITLERKNRFDVTVTKRFLKFDIPPTPTIGNTTTISFIQFSHLVEDEDIVMHPTTGKELISIFDIVPACFACEFKFTDSFDFIGVTSHNKLLECIATKTLLPNDFTGSPVTPIMSLERFYKYTAIYGFRVPSKEYFSSFNNYMCIPSVVNISYPETGIPF